LLTKVTRSPRASKRGRKKKAGKCLSRAGLSNRKIALGSEKGKVRKKRDEEGEERENPSDHSAAIEGLGVEGREVIPPSQEEAA